MIWCQSLEGGAFDLLNPTVDSISWNTVSIVLARVARYGGHTLQGTYSVAQHSIEGTRAILRDTGRRDWAAAFLLHDVHEAYIGDRMTPVQKAVEALAALDLGCDTGAALVNRAEKELKRRIDVAVYAKAGIAFPLDPETAQIVKEYDVRMALTERNARLAPYPMPWHSSIEKQRPVEGCDLTPWNEHLACALFKSALHEFIGGSEVLIPAPVECGCGAGCGSDVVTPWASDPSGPAPMSSMSLGNYTLGSDGVYRKEIEPVWR